MAEDMQSNLVQKVCYLCADNAIAHDRCWNLDEIATKIVPLSEYGHVASSSGVPDTRVQDSKVGVTVTAMVPWHRATGQWFAQLLFTGKTSKGLVQRERV
eukprot:2341370-Amphidinium_carterae.1